MNDLQKIGGVTAILEAAIYIFAFVVFGVFWSFPADANSVEKFAFLAANQTLYSFVVFVMYVLFGILLAVLVLALHERLKVKAPKLSQISAIFGVIWVGLVIASGMISNIGLAAAIKLSVHEPEQAMTLWRTINSVVEGLGGGNEIVGGLWVLSLSIAALQAAIMHKTLNYLGVFVGFVGILTVYPAEIFTAIFGISQIIWFLWLGICLLSNNKSE